MKTPWHKTEEGREYHRKYNREKWNASEKGKQWNSEYNKKWKASHKEELAEKNRLIRLDPKHRPRIKARERLRDQIKMGKIKRSSCTICGKKNAQAHHKDYNKPFEVEWFCSKHHLEHHGSF